MRNLPIFLQDFTENEQDLIFFVFYVKKINLKKHLRGKEETLKRNCLIGSKLLIAGALFFLAYKTRQHPREEISFQHLRSWSSEMRLQKAFSTKVLSQSVATSNECFRACCKVPSRQH